MPLEPIEKPNAGTNAVETVESVSEREPEIMPTETPDPVSTPLPTTVPSAEIAPLALTYQINWRLDPTDAGYALADVRLVATGGDGLYTYYRDDTLTNRPMFSYRWSSCLANAGSFRVESADGQSITVDYFEEPPCPDRGSTEVNNP